MDKLQQISCLVLDDQLFATKILKTYIEQMPQLSLVLSTTDVEQALSAAEKDKVDLIFLDIQMPKMNGLDFLRRCKDRSRFILTTAYPDYAIDGYEYDVVDFLLKPIAFERFQRSIDKYETLLKADDNKKAEATKVIVVKGDAKQKYYQLDVADILFVKGLNNYIAIHRISGSPIITYMNLKDMIRELPMDSFCQIHRSFIVSLAHIESVAKDRILIGADTLPISTSYKASFFARWKMRC